MQTVNELIEAYQDGLLNERELYQKAFMFSHTKKQDAPIIADFKKAGYEVPKIFIL